MSNGQRANPNGDAEKLQQALRAFGNGTNAVPPNSADIADLAQRMGLQVPSPTPITGPATARAQPTSGTQFLFIALSNTELALPTANIAGVERVTDITPVPNTVNWVLGVANLRGNITSVVDLRTFLGLPAEAVTARSRIIIASSGTMAIGFLVDGVNEMRNLPDEVLMHDGVRQVSPPWIAPFVTAFTQNAGRRILMIDIERLLFTDSLHHYRLD